MGVAWHQGQVWVGYGARVGGVRVKALCEPGEECYGRVHEETHESWQSKKKNVLGNLHVRICQDMSGYVRICDATYVC